MSYSEKVTYFGYYEGLDPSLLRLGSMVLDYANPRQKRPYYHAEIPDMFSPPAIATADNRPYCSMSERRSSSFQGDIGLSHLLLAGSTRSTLTSRLVVGTNGSKVELINPSEFFELAVKEAKVRQWLEVVLTVASSLRKTWKNAFSAPKIWLLTGVYLIEDATCLAVSSKSTTGQIQAEVPTPDPTGVAAILNTAVHAKVSLGNDAEGYAETKISGKRVWAAQWQQVSANYILAKQEEWDVKSRGMRLRLLDVFSLGTERGETEEVELVDLSLSNEPLIATDGPSDPGEEEMWQQFEEDVKELLEELEEEDE